MGASEVGLLAGSVTFSTFATATMSERMHIICMLYSSPVTIREHATLGVKLKQDGKSERGSTRFVLFFQFPFPAIRFNFVFGSVLSTTTMKVLWLLGRTRTGKVANPHLAVKVPGAALAPRRTGVGAQQAAQEDDSVQKAVQENVADLEVRTQGLYCSRGGHRLHLCSSAGAASFGSIPNDRWQVWWRPTLKSFCPVLLW